MSDFLPFGLGVPAVRKSIAAQAGVVAFDPTTTSGLWNGWDFTKLSGVDNVAVSGPIASTWGDGTSVSTPAGDDPPFYSSLGSGLGKSALHVAGGGVHYMSLGTDNITPSVFVNADTGISIYTLIKRTGAATDLNLAFWTNGNIGTYRIGLTGGVTVFNEPARDFLISEPAIAGWEIFSGRHTAAGYGELKSGHTILGSASGRNQNAPSTTDLAPFELFHSSNADNFYIALILIYKRGLTDTEDSNLINSITSAYLT
jgi:hypothetical protein